VQTARGASLIEQLPDPEPAAERAGSLQWVGMLCVAAVAVAADQATKHLIVDHMALGETRHLLPFLSVSHVRNTGIAFGIFPGRLEIITLLTGAAVAWMLLHFARSGSRHLLFPVALGLLIGGSVSNLADRIRLGYVVDFIHLDHWPTFNLADTFIVCGVLLLLLGLARLERGGDDASHEGVDVHMIDSFRG
jgi:signal peptidase II